MVILLGLTGCAGIDSISKGQRYAAMAVGLTPVQVYRFVLLPVAFRIIIPPLTSDFLGVFKNSSLGLTYKQNMQFVVLPQAFRNMIPIH